jgi:hypothetical protein
MYFTVSMYQDVVNARSDIMAAVTEDDFAKAKGGLFEVCGRDNFPGLEENLLATPASTTYFF